MDRFRPARQASILECLGVHDGWKVGRCRQDTFNIYHFVNGRVAPAGKDPDPRRLSAYVPLRRIGGLADLGARFAREEGHASSGCPTGVHDGLGNLLGGGKRAGDEYTGPAGIQRFELVGLAEAVLIELYLHVLGQRDGLGRGFAAHRQDCHVEASAPQVTRLVVVVQDEIVRLGVLLDL